MATGVQSKQYYFYSSNTSTCPFDDTVSFRANSLIMAVELSDQVVQATILAISVLVATVLYLLLNRGGNESSSKSGALNSTSGALDVSKSLQREHSNGSLASFSSNNNLTSVATDDKVLSASVFRSFTVLKITKISPNVKIVRFELPAGKSLGLSMGRHLTVRAEIDGTKVMRAYTPTTRLDQTGYFDLLFKVYEFGKMSNHLNNLKIGQSIEVRGPVGRFKYEMNSHQRIGLIAGGTGLTPCLQLIRNILQNPDYKDDQTCFTFFFQNRTEDDILLYDELVQLVKSFPTRLEIVFFLSNAGAATTTYGKNANEVRGYIAEDFIAEKMSPERCSLVCMCGPSGFNESIKKMLTRVGHDDKSLFIW